MKDFVEIYPVKEASAGFEPVFDDSARGSSSMSVNGPGSFDLTSNPDYVDGAYTNLRHHQSREALEARDLEFVVGQTYHLPIDANLLALVANSYTTSAGGSHTSGHVDGVIGQAARAGATAGATHVEIKIS